MITAEVQSFYGDGAVALHTRSMKYGKLVGGVVVTVAATLVKRQKQHFVHLDTIGQRAASSCCAGLYPGLRLCLSFLRSLLRVAMPLLVQQL